MTSTKPTHLERVRPLFGDAIGSINPDMLILARESRGLTQAALAEQIKVTQGKLSKMEAGLLPVTAETLSALCATLDYPPGFFSQSGALYGVGIAEIFHRKRADTPKRLLSMIYAQIEIRIRQMGALLRSVDIPVAVRRIDVDEYGGSGEDVARLVRSTWGIPPGPIHDLTATAEDAGFLILPMDFGTPHIDAISRWIPGMPPMVFVNERTPKDRYRFSLAHEIGHMVMHAFPTPDMEKQADAFAAELLCPEREVRADLHNLKLDRLPQLKRYWRVSMRALIHRAQTIGAITPNRAKYLWSQMAEAGYTKREPIELDIKGERPQLVFEMIAAHVEDLAFDLHDLRGLLNLNEHEFQDTYLAAREKRSVTMIPSAIGKG